MVECDVTATNILEENITFTSELYIPEESAGSLLFNLEYDVSIGEETFRTIFVYIESIVCVCVTHCLFVDVQ